MQRGSKPGQFAPSPSIRSVENVACLSPLSPMGKVATPIPCWTVPLIPEKGEFDLDMLTFRFLGARTLV